jgi:hypothetical protein
MCRVPDRRRWTITAMAMISGTDQLREYMWGAAMEKAMNTNVTARPRPAVPRSREKP